MNLPLSSSRLANLASLKKQLESCELEKKNIKRSLNVEQKDWENDIIDSLNNAPNWEVYY